MKMYKFLVVFYCLISVVSTAQNVYSVDSLYPVHPLDKYLLVFEDTTNELSIEEVKTISNHDFHPLEFYKESFKSKAVYWGLLRLHSDQVIENWLLQLEDQNKSIGGWGRGNSKVDIWAFLDGKQLWHKKTGSSYAAKERDIKPYWNQNRVQFSITAGDTTEYYIRVQGNSPGFKPYFNLVLRSPQFQDHHPFYDRYTFLNKVMLGALLIFLLYYVLSYLYLKENVFLWFVVWLFFTAITMAINTDIGLVNEFLLSNGPGIRMYLWPLCSSFVWFAFWFFGRVFIGTKEKYPILDKFILGLTAIIFVKIFVQLILFSIAFENRDVIDLIFNLLELLFKVIGLILALILVFKKDRLSQYFGVGAVLANLAPMLGVLWVTGNLDLPFDPFVWGIVLQMVAYSFGLVYRKQLQNIAFKKTQQDLIAAERAGLELIRKAEIDDLKSKFFANISHEFRTPLSLIMGPLKQAQRTSSREISISSNTFEMVVRNTERLRELVDQLLDLSKIEGGLTEVKLTRGDLMQFVQSIASDFESIAAQKSIIYHIHPSKVNETALYDKDKLQKIIHNLLSNAFKFTPDGKMVNFRFKTDQDYLYLEVEDTGSGIPEDQLNKIYDRFYRVESTESTGSGIGLALTKELIDLLNGKIEVDSEVGRGSCFYISIPIRLDLLPKAIVLNSNGPQKGPYENGFLELKKEEKPDIPKVLIVEDNEDLRTYISEILAPKYVLMVAEDGAEGERLALEYIPNVIVSDVMMPKKDGYALCQSLKSNVITSHIPVILLTAKAGQQNKMSGLTYGADAYMTKPFDAEELLLRISNLIEARQRIWHQFQTVGGAFADGLSLPAIDDQFFQKIQDEIKKNMTNEHYSVEDLALAVNFSRSQLHRKLKGLINKSASQLIRETRLNAAKSILEKKAMSVSEAAYSVGFSNLSYFAKAFKEYFGFLPSDLK